MELKSSELEKQQAAIMARLEEKNNLFNSENREPTPEEAEGYQKDKDEYEVLTPKIKRAKENEWLESNRIAKEAVQPSKLYAEPINHNERDVWFQRGMHDWYLAQIDRSSPSNESIRRAGASGLDITGGQLKLKFGRALQATGSIATGSGTMPISTNAMLTQKLLDIAPLGQYVRNMPRQVEETFTVQKSDDTGTLATITLEAPNHDTPEDDPTLSQVTIGNIEFVAGDRVSNRWLRSSVLNAVDFTNTNLVNRLAYKREAQMISGSGVANTQYEGILTSVYGVSTLASAATISYADVNKVFHAMPFYKRGRCVWVTNDQTLGSMETSVNAGSSGVFPAFSPNAQVGSPYILKGRPIVPSINMPTLDQAAKCVLAFIDPNDFVLSDVGEVVIESFRNVEKRTTFFGISLVSDFRCIGYPTVCNLGLFTHS